MVVPIILPIPASELIKDGKPTQALLELLQQISDALDEIALAGSATILNTTSTIGVTFNTARADANYAVAISTDGDERVWVTARATTGFTLNRSGTSGARVVDWIVAPDNDP